MIRKIVQTVDFVKASKNIKSILKNEVKLMFERSDAILRERLNKSEDVKGGKLTPLKASTLAHRKKMNISGSRPLIASGRLLKSIRLVEKGDRIGITFNGYGLYQAMGFKTHPFGNKNASEIYVDGRPWISPMRIGQGLSLQTKTSRKLLIKEIRKHLRGKVVHRFK